MDTNRLKRFAIEARNILTYGVEQRLKTVGFSMDGTFVEEPILHRGGATFMGDTISEDFYNKWKSLQRAIERKSAKEVVEEAAYTWFNRLIAISILADNGFVSPVLKYEAANVRVPLIVKDARQGRLPQMDKTSADKIRVLLQDDAKTNEQFRELIVAFCHATPIINKCFGRITDYTELLLPTNILASGNFVDMINNTEFISEEDYRSPELIGWLYQFYVSERKDEVFAKKGKVEANEIPAATQIFTPNWIVKYMVQNTLGRIYLDNNPSETNTFKNKWQYLVEPSEPTPTDTIYRYKDLTDLKMADLACGSGHILNEYFDILFDLYRYEGYSTAKAINNIFTRNLIGIDIDTRAQQLATFALLLKACQRDHSFVDAHCMPRIYDMPEPYEDKGNLREVLPHFLLGGNEEVIKELTDAIKLMDKADSLGSIMKFDISERTRNIIAVRMEEYESQEIIPEPIQKLMPYMNIILALTEKYASLVMNPPYMGGGNMNNVLSEYVRTNYADGKADLFSTFMLVAMERLEDKGNYGMITMQSWMFLSSFEKLRKNILDNYHIESLLHLGPHTFDELSGEVVQNVAFVVRKNKLDVGTYYRLVDGKDCSDKERMFLAGEGYYPNISQQNFEKIPGSPLSYWVSERMIDNFSLPQLSHYCESRAGLSSSDNKRFVRLWFEVDINRIDSHCISIENSIGHKCRWYPMQRGGGFRKWYGLHTDVLNWENNGEEIKQYAASLYKSYTRTIKNIPYYFKPGVTWSRISSSNTSFRLFDEGFIFIDAGPACFNFDKYGTNRDYILGYLNSKVANTYLKFLSPTLTFESGTIANLPYKDHIDVSVIASLVKENIAISKADWDAHETSWDFATNELVYLRKAIGDPTVTLNGEIVKDLGLWTLETYMNDYKSRWEKKFYQLHANEEELNRQFIEIYGLQDELTPYVPLSEVTILQQGEISIVKGAKGEELRWNDDVLIKQLISYAVGCMMGRYSIDKPGLILANQGDGLERYKELVPHSRFEVDTNGIIPLMSNNNEFTDNATMRFKKWLSVTFDEDNLTQNLNYVEQCLGKTIDSYFVSDFWKDHMKMYQNRPIYWLFASKKKTFQCIVYMHRMDAYTVGHLRTRYLLPHIEWLMNKQREMVANEANLSTRERNELSNLTKQIDECREYEERLHIVADKQIAIDLDDGVVVNYAKYGDVLAKIK